MKRWEPQDNGAFWYVVQWGPTGRKIMTKRAKPLAFATQAEAQKAADEANEQARPKVLGSRGLAR